MSSPLFPPPPFLYTICIFKFLEDERTAANENIQTDPKSLQGHLLLHRATFSAGASPPTKSRLLPRTLAPDSDYLQYHQQQSESQSQQRQQQNGTNNDASASSPQEQQQQSPPPPSILLLASPTGVLSTLTPLTEPQYRRLSILTTQLLSSLPHPCGLNPRDYRAPPASSPAPGVSVDGGAGGGGVTGSTVVDGGLLARWTELAAGRRAEVAGRVGFNVNADDVRDVLREVLGPDGLGYL